MEKIKLRISNQDPRGINRAIFNKPFNPSVNFALEDPLLLSCHPQVQKEGLSYTTYFGSNSPLSPKAHEFILKKGKLEQKYSDLIHMDKSYILPFCQNIVNKIQRAFLQSQQYFIPESSENLFPGNNCLYFSLESLETLESLLQTSNNGSIPVVYLPSMSALSGQINYPFISELKEKYQFFLIVEDSHTFGQNGYDGFGHKRFHQNIDLLITHVPKTFGKMLSIVSGKADLLNTLIEFSFFDHSQYFCSAYLGMCAAMIDIIPTMQGRRESLLNFASKLSHTFSEDSYIFPPLLTFKLESKEEKAQFSKYLVDKGFLLPASSFTNHNKLLTLHINYLLEEKSIHALFVVNNSKKRVAICESI